MYNLTPIIITNSKTIFNVNCPFCDKEFSNYAIKRHKKTCALNPVVATKIISYLDLCLIDINQLMKKNYEKFAKLYKTPAAGILLKSIPPNYDGNYKWNCVIPYLILHYYEKGLLEDIEKYDLLTRIVTLNSYGMNYENFDKHRKKFINDNSLDISDNYKALYFAIISRTIKDYEVDKKLDENDEVIDKEFLKEWLQEFYPNYFKARKLHNK